MTLDSIDMNIPCIVSGFDKAKCADDTCAELALRLMEMGLTPGVNVKKLHAAPLSRDPLAIEVNGQLLAMRRAEAAAILVTPL